jgi:hypothetical protein
MRLRELLSSLTLTEATADTKDVLQISQGIMDWIYLNKATAAGTVIDVSKIPGLKATTPEGQTLINTTRIKIVSPETFKSPNTQGDAASYYRDDKGRYVDYADPYKDARWSRETNKIRDLMGDPNVVIPFKPTPRTDMISSRAEFGYKMDIRLRADQLASNDWKPVESTLTHELSHHLDTIKGMDTVAAHRKDNEAKAARERLYQHNQAKQGETVAKTSDGKIIMPTRKPELLDPKEEKRLIGIIKKAPKAVPGGGESMAYWKDRSEVNARLMQASEDLAEYVPTIVSNRNKFGINSQQADSVIRHMLNTNSVTVAFVDFASEDEFFRALRSGLTQAEQRKAYANPEFKKIYNRIYKFLEDEMGPGGILAQAAKTGFKDWDQSVSAAAQANQQSLRKTFIERFKDVVVRGLSAAKDVAKLALRYNKMADDALARLLKRTMPLLVGKGLLKSVPVAGAVIGVAFGIDRLIKGDVPGAGIELVSGIGSLITAIPATAYQAARDLYGEYYTYQDTNKPAVIEYDAAQDPQGTEQRVRELSDKIARELRAGIEQNRSILKSLPSKVEPNLGMI